MNGNKVMNRFIVTLILGAATFFLPPKPTFGFPNTMYVTAEVLNVREAPFPDAPVATKLTQNSQIVVLDSLDGWGAIEDPDQPGVTFWVSLRYLSDSPVRTNSQSSRSGSSGSDDYSSWLVLAGLILLLGGKGILRLIGLGLLLIWLAVI